MTPPTAETQALAPTEARKYFRAGNIAPTSGWASGFTQTNLISIPEEWAYDFLLFAQRNPKPCPVLDVSDVGSHTTILAPGADIRADLPAYRIWKDGELVDEVVDVTEFWREDLVSFHIGCSFTFEDSLVGAGIPLRHREQGVNVPMYITQRQCRPAGRISGPLVVSMRPIPASMVANAATASNAMPGVHGAPVHVGDPESLLIDDIDKPQFGDAVTFEPGDVPVFWACGVTPQAAIVASGIPFAITHAPGHMLITDQPDRHHISGDHHGA
ncbi:hypothetical protein CH251_05420 [Rhodococcus sp. 06-462-5]|uniref:putative hydro-lyase n=1 Tax=unclassified Rhodococcus (in: high G+C Gram-positive bacteria) TaxID=192944 RepID=UPI000B9BD6F9|nr:MULTISPECIES: putative hydro-lyase [unclassified Rhodococcus (in: high G+C Gram-positive bacteria)]OZC77232.1 hypothetical protein CH251_05420 [Rhodococcus sp. 06-462-5]OZE63389.1 hypothetical protein CH270_18000 [Rhodococcus sp. 02-925g]